jgi:hypothetical protein
MALLAGGLRPDKSRLSCRAHVVNDGAAEMAQNEPHYGFEYSFGSWRHGSIMPQLGRRPRGAGIETGPRT